ncbi:MAG: hypothetical protein QOG53_1721 [Frankiales bacterium]|jgi:hypothetical protein|nr:hypothetical protein [Frankiales bacterium]
MTELGPFVLFGLGACLVGALGIYTWWRNQKRVEALGRFCLSKGWQFTSRDDSLCVRWMGEPFFQGRNRQARAVVRGVENRPSGSWPFVAFDYTYVTESSDGNGHKQSTTHRFAVCAVTLPTWLPALTLTPENVLSRIGNIVGGEDIELESEDFNRKYRVQSPDSKFASDVLPPRTMEMLLARPTLHFRIDGQDVLCWESGGTTPMSLLPRLATLTDFVAGIPDFVWHDYGSNSARRPV